MGDASVAKVVRQLRQVVLHRGECVSDSDLLERFTEGGDDRAFASLVERHGPMVLGVCRRVLGNVHDAEDAFQAAFLVLARRASSVYPRENVGKWLYGVAYRSALEAQKLRKRRWSKERQVEVMPESTVEPSPVEESIRPILDEEVGRLPTHYRDVLVLCDLQGKSRKEAAHLAGLPEGTLSSRLARARKMLAGRLTQRGVTLSVGALALFVGRGGTACASKHLVYATVDAVCDGSIAPSGTVAILTRGVMKAMVLTQIKLTCVVGGLALFVGIGGMFLLSGAEPTDKHPAKRPGNVPAEKATTKDKPSIEGIWAPRKADANGLHLPRETDTGQRWIITRDSITIVYPDNSQAAYRYLLHPDKKPNAIDLWPLRFEGTRFMGVFEQKGNSLSIRYTRNQHPSAKRPRIEDLETGFDFDRGARYYVFRRVHPVALRVSNEGEKGIEWAKTRITDSNWSKPVNGLQGRVVLRQKGKKNGTNLLGLDLELKNTTAKTISITNDPEDVRIEILDIETGQTLKPSVLPRNGPVPNPVVCKVPGDAYLGFAIDASLAGIPKDCAAFLSLRNQDWLLEPGRYALLAKYTVAKTKIRPEGVWLGELNVPLITFEVPE